MRPVTAAARIRGFVRFFTCVLLKAILRLFRTVIENPRLRHSIYFCRRFSGSAPIHLRSGAELVLRWELIRRNLRELFIKLLDSLFVNKLNCPDNGVCGTPGK